MFKLITCILIVAAALSFWVYNQQQYRYRIYTPERGLTVTPPVNNYSDSIVYRDSSCITYINRSGQTIIFCGPYRVEDSGN
jgi:hypothetical protein